MGQDTLKVLAKGLELENQRCPLRADLSELVAQGLHCFLNLCKLDAE